MKGTREGNATRSKPAAAGGGSPLPAVAEVFKALGDPERLRVLHLFLTTKEEICVCELVDALELPQYQVSRHLQALKRVGLLRARKRGTWAYYSAAPIQELQASVTEVVARHCAGEAFEADKARLAERFSLRAGGRCVVGFAESRELAEGKACDECD